jgi:hypothetical protein
MSTLEWQEHGYGDTSRRLRDALRRGLPEARDGFVALDVDLLVRWYGPRYSTDATGRLALVELKHGTAGLGEGQRRTLRLLDQLARRGDTEGRFVGTFLVHDLDDCWRIGGVRGNLTDDQLAEIFDRQMADCAPLFGVA